MRIDQKRIDHAIIISDIHLGWAACGNTHLRLLNNLYKIADAAELIILNGDIIDHLRKTFSRRSRGLIRKACDLVRMWRACGKGVIYIEGNHDRAGIVAQEFIPEYPFFEFTGTGGEKIFVFHGHEEMSPRISEYDNIGSALLSADNYAYTRIPLLRPFLSCVGARFHGLVACCEDLVWHDRIRRHLARFRPDADVIVHGHMHFGPFHYTVNGRPVYRSGSWVSDGQTGVPTGLLRYVMGKFERLDLVGDEWVPCPFSAE
jgi:UDP-2,3-diacylglucosamine pyrophosphatase LpxH